MTPCSNKKMGKKHSVVLTITNHSGHDMTYKTDWFDSGRLSNGYGWPHKIPNGADDVKISCYEKDGALAGCSGLVTYTIGGTDLTIAFSNPSAGTNKLGVGTTGKDVWDNMSNHDYGPFTVNITLHDKTKLAIECQCSGGETNSCTVKIEVNNGDQ